MSKPTIASALRQRTETVRLAESSGAVHSVEEQAYESMQQTLCGHCAEVCGHTGTNAYHRQ